jgi:hypothetical protein
VNRPHSLTDSATAKLNQAERFGVGLGETCGLNSDEDLPPERLDLELEQHYHTRLLAHVLDVFDLTFQVVPPPFVMRQFLKTGVFLPERLGILFVGARRWRAARCSTSCVASALNCSPTNPRPPSGHAALRRNPHRARTRRYCASRCTAAERAVMRWLFPRIGKAVCPPNR